MRKDSRDQRITRSKFRAPWWLSNRQAQTIFPQLLWAFTARMPLRRETLELPDGDATAIDWPQSGADVPQSAPLLVILHGLEGSAESIYAKTLMHAATKRGWRSCVLHSRDCGDYRNRLPRRYHAGETNDIRYFLTQLRERGNTGPLFAAGYSLGGNILLKYLGEAAAQSPLEAAVAVCAPLDLHQCAYALNSGFSKVYQHYLIKRMKTALRRKFSRHTAAFDWRRAMQASTFAEFDDAVTAPLHGFANMQDYYARCSSGQFLKDIRRPTLLINSLDDPFMTPAVIPQAENLGPNVMLELSDSGGHVGFIEGGTPWRPRYYLPSRILAFFETYAASTSFMDNRTRP